MNLYLNGRFRWRKKQTYKT